MAIAKNPKRNTKEKQAEAFIAAAEEPHVDRGGRKPIMLRIPADMLPRIDRAAERLGLTRSGFLVMSAAERLQRMETE